MRQAGFSAWILTVFSLPALSFSDRCSGDSILHRFNDRPDKCCQPVTVPPGHERRICEEDNGRAEYVKCSSHTYQDTNYSSVKDRTCKQHAVCSKPNMVVDVPGNSTSNTVCKCNEADGYKAQNAAGRTATLEPHHCLLDGTYESRKGTSNAANTTIESPSDTTETPSNLTELPSNTTETAETVCHPVTVIIVGIIIAFIVITSIALIAAFIVKKRRTCTILGLKNSACQWFRRNQRRQNGAQTIVGIREAEDCENCSLNIRTGGHEEGDAVGNGHVTSNRACLLSTLSHDGLSETDERHNDVSNGHVPSNGACLHSTPLSLGLSETDELQSIIDLHEDSSSLCAQSNSTEFQN